MEVFDRVIFKTKDKEGYESIHECDNEEQAKQAHLLHYGLIAIQFLNIDIINFNTKDICKERLCQDLIKEMQIEGYGSMC